MSINSLSRYRYSDTPDDNGIVLAVKKVSYNTAVYQYTVRPGDTFDTLAAALYGDSGQYWRLADLNPQIKNPLDLKAGDVIRIPQ